MRLRMAAHRYRQQLIAPGHVWRHRVWPGRTMRRPCVELEFGVVTTEPTLDPVPKCVQNAVEDFQQKASQPVYPSPPSHRQLSTCAWESRNLSRSMTSASKSVIRGPSSHIRNLALTGGKGQDNVKLRNRLSFCN